LAAHPGRNKKERAKKSEYEAGCGRVQIRKIYWQRTRASIKMSNLEWKLEWIAALNDPNFIMIMLDCCALYVLMLGQLR
jgi:hypothetical protein